MADLVAQFCEHHHAYNGVSTDRRRMQLRVLRAFETKVGRPFADLQADDLRVFLSSEVERGLSPATVAKHLRAITPFVRWLGERQVIDSVRVMQLGQVRAPRGANGGQPRPYSTRELERFWRELDYAYPPAEEPERWLRRFEKGYSRYPRVQAHAKRTQIEAIVALALYGGLRRGEIYGLSLEDAHPDNAYVVVRGAAKNPEAVSRARIVPWFEPMHRAVATWYALRERLAPEHDFPWLSLHQAHYRKPMRFRQFEMLLHNIGRGWEYHRLRHTFATEALRAGMPVEILRRTLGHASLGRTLRYAELVEGDVLRAALKVEEKFVRAIGSTRR